jgi:hypothetical protein
MLGGAFPVEPSDLKLIHLRSFVPQDSLHPHTQATPQEEVPRPHPSAEEANYAAQAQAEAHSHLPVPHQQPKTHPPPPALQLRISVLASVEAAGLGTPLHLPCVGVVAVEGETAVGRDG